MLARQLWLLAPLAAQAFALSWPTQGGPNIMALDENRKDEQLLCARVAPGAAALPPSPQQTPPPSLMGVLAQRLYARQDNGQILALSAQIQSLSIVASSASQASRLVSQTSQQLAQQVTQLSQSTDRLAQSINQLQTSAQQAQQAQQSAQDAARQASQSASQAIASAQRSASSTISVLSTNLASASSMAAAASSSAVKAASAAASQMQAAQAGGTGRGTTSPSSTTDTNLTGTQLALAIVSTFVGSSLLTIGAVYLFLHHRRKMREKRNKRTHLVAERGSQYQYSPDYRNLGGASGYPIDLKRPPPMRMTAGRASVNLDGDEKTEDFPRRPSSDYGPRDEMARDSSVAIGLARTVTISKAKRASLSLQDWLKDGTVSPFGSLRRNIGVGGVIASRPQVQTSPKRTSQFVQPGRGFPFRES